MFLSNAFRKIGLLVGGVAVMILVGCTETETIEKTSPEMTESATVADLVYTPSNHGDGVGPTINMAGHIGIAFTEIDVPEKYAVVFECQHGKFIIDNQDKAPELWRRLKRDQKVTVRYNEVYEESSTVTTDWGREVSRQLNSRKLLKYHFIDAR